jgi:hypothetical protein
MAQFLEAIASGVEVEGIFLIFDKNKPRIKIRHLDTWWH